MPLYGELIVAAVILVGLVGIVIPVLPGTLLVGGAILVWAIIVGGAAWAVFAIVAVVLAVGEVVKYFLAGRTLKSGGIPNITVIVGGLAAIVGFFVIPLVGLFVGFIVGAAATELIRTRDGAAAWRGTIAAIKAAVVTIGIELVAALIATGIWTAGAFTW
uniref:DUF456 domain-containing protein n=1 Tax=Gordonia sp. B7-2 TaxID=3420932 RepID=UPI003D8CD5F7